MGTTMLTKEDVILHDRACAPLPIIVNGQGVVTTMLKKFKNPTREVRTMALRFGSH
jgi:hypothetical protein